MAYSDIAALTRDADFQARIMACYAVETLNRDDLVPTPEAWTFANLWELAAQPGFGDAYAYAIANHPDDPTYRPGNDPAVITDGMILGAVQPLLPPEPEPPADPVTVTSLEPASASITDPDFEGHIRGTGFTEDTVIVWNGGDEPTHFVDSTDVWTTVKPSVVTSPTTVSVTVRNGDQTVEPDIDFTWTE
jgi:hypothetical protein